MLVATGGPGVVKMLLSSGKKAIGAGAGNPPVVVDDTATFQRRLKILSTDVHLITIFLVSLKKNVS